MMSVGNHETYFNFSAYKARFRMPDASPGAYENFWYSYDVGPVHFLVFSTEHSVASNSTQVPNPMWRIGCHGGGGFNGRRFGT